VHMVSSSSSETDERLLSYTSGTSASAVNEDCASETDKQERRSSNGSEISDPIQHAKVQFSDISTAAFNLRDGITRTPTMKSRLSSMFGLELYLKKEYLQVTGSFKERGARFALMRLSPREKKAGVIAASAGNHALALAYHGQQLGISVTVVMPMFAPLMKLTCCESYGAKVILYGDNMQKSKEHADELAKTNNLTYINGFDHPDVIAGQGTIGLEILEQVDNVDALVVPVGGGGLIAGIGIAVKTLKPDVLIIGVESETCTSFRNAFLEEQNELFPDQSLADGLAVPQVGYNAVQLAKGLVDELITVSEQSIALAILRLIEVEKSIVEGAGAVGLAAFISGKLDHLKGKRVVTILTGGNIDTTVLGRTLERGLAEDGRLIKIDVVVSDRPGGIAELTALIANLGGSVKDIFHERAWLSANVYSVQVRVIVETRDKAHVKELMDQLGKRYKQINFPKNEWKNCVIDNE